MLPQLLTSQLTDNTKTNDDSVRIIYDNCDIILALVRQVGMDNIAMVKWNILRKATVHLDKFLTKKPVLYLELFETYCNSDIVKHIRGIIDDVGKVGYDIHVNIVSEFDPDLSELLLCEYITKITWDRSSYVSFVDLKNTAKKKQDGMLSAFGNYFVPGVVNNIREVFNIDLSNVDSFESIYAGDDMFEILNDVVKTKSVILK